MRFRRRHQARPADKVSSVVYSKQIDCVPGIERVDLQWNRPVDLLPFSARDVDFISNAKIAFEMILIRLAVRPIDDMKLEHDAHQMTRTLPVQAWPYWFSGIVRERFLRAARLP
ncbi:protein of unknown function [Aminobacter niigataensis]|nr:protein of unknown function [Aminobacter niigataensis]